MAYSNMGMSLLGLILSEAGGKSYEALVTERILAPLQMQNSFFAVPPEENGKFPEGRLVDVHGQSVQVPHWNLFETAIDPAGGLVSNIDDIIKYARAMMNPDLNPLRASIEMTHQPLRPYSGSPFLIGMNWLLKPSDGIVFHNGRTYGFNSVLIVSKAKNQGIIALSDTNVLKTDSSGNESYDDSLQNIVFKCFR